MSAVDFEQQLRAALVGHAGVTALVGARVYPLLIPEGTPLPCVTYQRVSGTPENTLEGHSGLEEVMVQVDCWSATYGGAKALAKQVRAAMAAAPFGSYLDQDRDLYDGEPNNTIYRVSCDYRCWHSE